MIPSIHVFLLLVGAKVSGATNFLLEGASAWATPSSVKRCPAHSPVIPRNVNRTLPGVEFTGGRKEKFSLIEVEVPEGSLAGSGGLRLRFTSATPAWTLRLGDSSYNSHTRYVAAIDGGNSDQAVFVPWRAFKGQSLHRGGINFNGQDVQAERVRKIGVMLPGRKRVELGSGNFILRDLVAIPLPQGLDPSIAAPVFLNSDNQVSSNVEAQCSCDYGCARCAIMSYLSSGICTSSHYELLCVVSASGLMRRLAEGFSTDDCASDKQMAVRKWLQSSQYLEKCLPTHNGPVGAAILDLMLGLIRTDLNADSSQGAECEAGSFATNLTGFVGPFVGMGISGHNDVEVAKGVTAEACLELCRANTKCRSVDYGARDKVIGECWLSTANRESAGKAFEPWPLYDYYEVSEDSTNEEIPKTQTALQQTSSISTEQQNLLLESAGLMDTDCCKQPSSCIKGAIQVGISKYNAGDAVSCFFLYHAAASRIGQCDESGALGYPLFMQIAARTGASDLSANSAAWQLRRALDIVQALKSSDCGATFPPEDDVAAPSPFPETTLVGELAENFVGPFTGMGISGHNDMDSFRGKSVPDCLKECFKQPRCKSVDFGARGKVTGECWLSTANRSTAGNAYTAWELYDYYERTPNQVGEDPSTDLGIVSPELAAEEMQDGENGDASQSDSLSEQPVASSATQVICREVSLLLFIISACWTC